MEMRYLLLFKLCIISTILAAQVSIIGHAPQFPNQRFYLWKYEDFISGKLSLIQDTLVSDRGIFKFRTDVSQIQKMVLGNDQLTAYLYVQPNSTYTVEFIADNPQHSSYNLKEEVELTFFDLDSNDINYKILGFHAWIDNYMADIFVEREVNPGAYASKITFLKMLAAKDIKADTSTYFANFIRYTIANDIDNQRYLGAPSNQEKYRQYLERSPIRYECDFYMDYFKSFYNQYLSQIDSEISDKLFAAFAANNLTASDTLLAKCDYSSNPELRSLLRIYLLKQALSDDFLPKTVILSNLKNISKNSIYPEHRKIALNVLSQVDLIQVGSSFILEELVGTKERVNLSKISNKHIYLHAFNPSNTNAISELSALKKLIKTYGSKIEFVTIYVEKNDLNTSEQHAMEQINWTRVGFPLDHEIWTSLGIRTFPYYILIDRDFNVMAAPALSPTPNGKYETIEKTFFELSKP
jgi:hypothetical protein